MHQLARTRRIALPPPAVIMERSVTFLDGSIEALLVAALLFMPLALGAVQPWSELIVMGVGALIALLLVVRSWMKPSDRLPRTAAFVPMGAYIVLAVVQLVSLPQFLVRLLSPGTASMKAQLLSDLPDATARFARLTLSFYPPATKHDLRIVVFASVIFIAVLVVFQSERQIRRLLAEITVIAGVLAILALVQDISGASGIYWRIPLGDLPWYGTFVAHSHFGQHMNLSIGAGLGLLLCLPETRKPASRQVLAMRVGLIVVIALCAISVVNSRTRAGTIAVIAGGILFLVVVIVRRGLSRPLLAITGVAVLLIAGIVIFNSQRVYRRMATLDSAGEYALRVTTTHDILGIWSHFPLFGTGLGTHETFFPRYDSTLMTGLSTHAENDYDEALEETGIVGVACALVFAAIAWDNWRRAVFTPGPQICLAAAGLGYGLLAVLIQSMSDFGQHLPAVAALTAITCALLVNLRRLTVAGAAAPALRRSSRRLDIAGAIGVAALAGFAVWAVCTSVSPVEAEVCQLAAQQFADTAQSSTGANAENAYAALISTEAQAVAAQPEDVRYRYWLDVYRWRAAKSAATTDDPANDPECRVKVASIASDLSEARLLCPTYGSVDSLLGQLEYYVLGAPQAAADLKTAALLAPHEPACCFLAGSLYAKEENWEAAAGDFRRAYFFDPTRIDSIVDVYSSLNRCDLVPAVAPEDYRWLARVSEIIPDKNLQLQTRQKAIYLLQARAARKDATADQLAQLGALYAAAGDDTNAADAYRSALWKQRDQVQWRLARAKALNRLDRLDEARSETFLCLELSPDLQEAKDLLASIERRTGN